MRSGEECINSRGLNSFKKQSVIPLECQHCSFRHLRASMAGASLTINLNQGAIRKEMENKQKINGMDCSCHQLFAFYQGTFLLFTED